MRLKAKPKKLKFTKMDRKGIPLGELISVHRQFQPKESLPLNLGDGFLCATNPIYRNIRQELLRGGFSFSLKDTMHYFSFPLMSLDRVLEEKVIPYRDNFFWLLELEKYAPGIFSLTELKRCELQFNYLFHESAHCIAHWHFFGSKKIKKIPKNKVTLLKILVGEAFANTTEALSALFVEGEIGNYFLDANCHFRSNEREVKTLTRFAREEGIKALATVLFASFLYSNFMYEKLEEKEYRLVRAFASLSELSNIASVVKVGLSLSSQFRTTTTQLHLIKLGFRENLNSFIIQDPIRFILDSKNRRLRKQVDELFEILVSGINLADL